MGLTTGSDWDDPPSRDTMSVPTRILDLLWFHSWKKVPEKIFLPKTNPGNLWLWQGHQNLDQIELFKDDKLTSSSPNHTEPIQQKKGWGLYGKSAWSTSLTLKETCVSKHWLLVAISSSNRSHPSPTVFLEKCAEKMDGNPQEKAC